MLLISNVPFSVFDLHLKNQQPILVWFAQGVSLKVDIQSFWKQIYGCQLEAFSKQHVMFSSENYTVAVVKALKSKVTELGISNL